MKKITGCSSKWVLFFCIVLCGISFFLGIHSTSIGLTPLHLRSYFAKANVEKVRGEARQGLIGEAGRFERRDLIVKPFLFPRGIAYSCHYYPTYIFIKNDDFIVFTVGSDLERISFRADELMYDWCKERGGISDE